MHCKASPVHAPCLWSCFLRPSATCLGNVPAIRTGSYTSIFKSQANTPEIPRSFGSQTIPAAATCQHGAYMNMPGTTPDRCKTLSSTYAAPAGFGHPKRGPRGGGRGGRGAEAKPSQVRKVGEHCLVHAVVNGFHGHCSCNTVCNGTQSVRRQGNL